MKKILILLSIAGVFAYASQPVSNSVQKAYEPFPVENLKKKVDFPVNSYAYAPATVYYNGTFHQFYCSKGNSSDDNYFHPDREAFVASWDHIRYRTSKDGWNWSAPRIALTVSIGGFGTENERCACDPSVVYDSLDGYWYMMYDGNLDKYSGTVVYLARSRSIGGPYEKYTGNGWERYPKKPKPIMTNYRNFDGYHDNAKYVINPLKDAKGKKIEDEIYGVGQQSVVFKDGYFHVWFNDKEAYYRKGCEKTGKCETYFEIRYIKTRRLESINFDSSCVNNTSVFKKIKLSDPNTTLKDSSRISYGISGIDEVRWNPKRETFELWTTSQPSEGIFHIHKYSSKNGVYWSRDTFDIGPYHYIHNMGISSNEYGWVDDSYLISFSAPNDGLNQSISGPRPVSKGIWPIYQIWVKNDKWYSYSVKINNGAKFDIVPKDAEYYSGDFDGDGITDIGVLYRGRINKWYTVYSQKNGYAGDVLKTEAKVFRGMSNKHKIVIGDFDGDGKDDRGMYTESGEWYIYSSKTNGGEGIYLTSNDVTGFTNIPWGWTWPGMTNDFAVPSGDYDGDGITDRVIVNTTNGLWYMLSSRFHNFMYVDVYDTLPSEKCVDGNSLLFTAVGCVEAVMQRTHFHDQDTLFGYYMAQMNANREVVVGDFDGDGMADRAIVDKSEKKWYVIPSASQNNALPINRRGDKLYGFKQKNLNTNSIIAIGDYDGDGIDDLSFVNKEKGKWYFRRSTTGKEDSVTWRNLNTSDPIQLLPGDYDGDMVTDMAFVNPKTGRFYVRSSKMSETGWNHIGVDETIYKPYPVGSLNLAKERRPKIDEDEMILPEPELFDIESAGKSLHISGLVGTEKVAVMDIRGKVVYSSANHGTELNVNLPNSGKYIVRVGSASKMITVK